MAGEACSCLYGTRVLESDKSEESWAGQPCVLGIDEAGRGPVLGAMVYAAAVAPESSDLSGRDFNDSKALTAERRDSLFDDISNDPQIGYCAEILSAQFISACMLSRDRVSLNLLAMESTYKIIRSIMDKGYKLTKVFIDTVGDAERYAQRLAQQFPSLQFTVCPKADALYPVVSAASIVAKVLRDRALESNKKDVGVEEHVQLGSGYPADPHTKAWLRSSLNNVFGFSQPQLVRFSWETANKLVAETAIDIKFEADADEGKDAAGSGTQQRLSFAPATRQGAVVETQALGRHAYFRARKLARIGDSF
ncbi:ribonuclease H-like domain-containing protein [Dunaliella salina]|uniref:Ribonuclease n=1 Tax=Dunaliella salina TaxID=3046 RepID=A0ABQ7FUF7_DUNSA|nr:ribonuclease H-like domain-containing protein [Dunaliella salina]|eukprot:KAF5826044.1 ribonuclease H-like domain-containing protein [Dunaliella salina]